MTVQSTVFECCSQELGWVLRGIFITQRTVFRSDLRISRDNYGVNLMPPFFESCRVPGDIHYIHVVMQPGIVQPTPAASGCEHTQELNWNRATFFQYIA